MHRLTPERVEKLVVKLVSGQVSLVWLVWQADMQMG